MDAGARDGDQPLADLAVAREERGPRTVLEAMLGALSEGVLTIARDGQVLSWNPPALAMHGMGSGDVLRDVAHLESTFDLVSLDGAPIPADEGPLRQVLRGEAVDGLEVRLRPKDGAWERVVLYRAAPLVDSEGPAVAVVSITDLTARHEAVAARVESEERLRVANEASAIGTYDIDFSLGQIRYSPEMCVLLGVDGVAEHPEDESLGSVHPDDAEDFGRLFLSARDPDGGGTARGEHRFVHASGEVRWATWSARTSFGSTPEGRRAVRTIGAYVDVTEPRRAERRLATQNAVSHSLVTAVVNGDEVAEILRSLCESEGWDLGVYWEVDPLEGVLRCLDLWQRPEVDLTSFVATTRVRVLPPDEGLAGRAWAARAPIVVDDAGTDASYERADEAAAAGLRRAVAFPIVMGGEVSGVLEFVGRASAGQGGEPLEMLAVVSRVLGQYLERNRATADREQLESRLRLADRMESIGVLSGGIAHDFNNILGVIVGNTELAREDVGPGHAATLSLDAIMRASQHARALVQQILTFARQGPVERRVASLTATVEQSVDLLRSAVPAEVELTLSCDADCPPVLADLTQVEQIVVNLATNSWHALGGRPGRIDISIAPVTVDAGLAARLPGLQPGPCVLLSVRDTGMGIDAAVLDRIFDPFFTTKAHGVGTGLGLSVVHGIVERHDGAILVSSVPGRSTSFDIYFPAAAGAERSGSDAVVGPRLVRGQGEHILLLDDDPQLVALAERMLPRMGYVVTGCTDAGSALDLFTADPQGFAMVITEVALPGTSGIDVADRVHQTRPELPVVLVSTNPTRQMRSRAHDHDLHELLDKPLDMRALSTLLDRILHPAAT